MRKLAYLFVCLLALPAAGQPWAGSGTEGDPYQIWDACDMQAIGADPNFWDAHFKLMADIDLSGFDGLEGRPAFNIIGKFYYDEGWIRKPFIGVFDGNSRTISNFTYISPDKDRVGIFGYADPNAEIKNLGLINPDVNVGTGDTSGLLVGGLNENATITRCYVEGGSFSGDSTCGGLVGWNHGRISECYSSASVNGNLRVGGLVGFNHFGGVLSNCYAHGAVSGGRQVGGLLGYSIIGTVTNCYSTGRVSGSESVGGLIGRKNSATTVEHSFWDRETSEQMSSAGGTSKNTIQMQARFTFTNAGWDFVGEVINGPNDFWDICDGTNYPKLSLQIPLQGDFVCPDGVTFVDFSVLGEAWMCEPNDYCWDPNCDISEPNDNIIDESDVMVFTDNWLEGL